MAALLRTARTFTTRFAEGLDVLEVRLVYAYQRKEVRAHQREHLIGRLDPQEQRGDPHRGGSRFRDPALYLQRLIHGSCYATHSKTSSQTDLRMEAELPRSCRRFCAGTL